jgi:hypothetical protein
MLEIVLTEVMLCVAVVVLLFGNLMLRSMLKELEARIANRISLLETTQSHLETKVYFHNSQQSLPHGLGERFKDVWHAIHAKADKPLLRRKGDKAGPTISNYDNERDGDWTICCKHTKKGAKK